MKQLALPHRYMVGRWYQESPCFCVFLWLRHQQCGVQLSPGRDVTDEDLDVFHVRAPPVRLEQFQRVLPIIADRCPVEPAGIVCGLVPQVVLDAVTWILVCLLAHHQRTTARLT